jgi:hypothetical protein
MKFRLDFPHRETHATQALRRAMEQRDQGGFSAAC